MIPVILLPRLQYKLIHLWMAFFQMFIKHMSALPETFCKLRMILCNPVMHLFSVFLNLHRKGMFILAGYIDNLLQMLLQVFQPLIFVKLLHMRPSSMQQILDIPTFF